MLRKLFDAGMINGRHAQGVSAVRPFTMDGGGDTKWSRLDHPLPGAETTGCLGTLAECYNFVLGMGY